MSCSTSAEKDICPNDGSKTGPLTFMRLKISEPLMGLNRSRAVGMFLYEKISEFNSSRLNNARPDRAVNIGVFVQFTSPATLRMDDLPMAASTSLNVILVPCHVKCPRPIRNDLGSFFEVKISLFTTPRV